MKYSMLILGLLLLQSCASIDENPCSNLEHNCTFVLFNESDNNFTIINPNRAEQRFTPASTFKIANSLIALETGVIADTTQALFIDMNKYPPQPWWQPTWDSQKYNLRTAFQNSVLPVYQGIASDIGEIPMAAFVKQFSYGNQDISSGIDAFWLNGSLQISALEQIEFLRGVYHNDYQLEAATLDGLLNIMLVEETESYKLFAKTGGSLLDDGSLLVWYVGFVTNNKGVHYFAFNLEGEPSPETNQARFDLSLNYLRQYGVI